jgi:hypothetical protein
MKDIADLVKKAGDIDLYRRIVNLEGEVIDLTPDKRRAEEKIEQLERALQFQGELKFRTPYFYAEGDPDPYCPGCWGSKRQAVRVTKVRIPSVGNCMQCPACKHNFGYAGIS